jgi:hypothetical protein
MQDLDQIIQTNNLSNASQSSCAEQHTKPRTQARTQQPLKKVKALEHEASIPSPLQTLPAWLQQAVRRITTLLQLEEVELALWLEEYTSLPPRVLLHFLHQIRKYELDPLSDEIILLKNSDGQYQTLITIDGWMKLINQDPQFAGITCKESTELEEGIRLWMECSIYRHDRILPITVKEYYAEIKTEHAFWKAMPRRMLRHRAIQQCARLAFNIHCADHAISLKQNDQKERHSKASENISQPNISRSEWLKKRLLKSHN